MYQMIIFSLFPLDEINLLINEIERPVSRFVPWVFFPRFFSLEQYFSAVDKEFIHSFLMSVFYTTTIVIFHFIYSFVLGFIFAKINFKGKDVLFYIFIGAMVLPFFVTLVPLNRIVNFFRLIDTPFSIILPAIFSPLGVFLFRQFISQVSDDILEAAAIDGADIFITLKNIVLPMIRGGISVFLLITITTSWTNIEHALAFIRTSELMPLSILMRELITADTTRIFASSILYMFPILAIYPFILKQNTHFV